VPPSAPFPADPPAPPRNMPPSAPVPSASGVDEQPGTKQEAPARTRNQMKCIALGVIGFGDMLDVS
jgi:hypothetical protein